ncbi:hypothetical protein N9B31_01390 [Mariniblastus sp.]|nr:hypothetical protein [Mariniblastus sp.]
MSNRRQPSSSSALPKLLLSTLIVVGLGLVLYGVANSMGWLPNKAGKVTAKPSREGRVAVPRTLMSLKAFEKVRREDVFDRELADESYFWLPKETVESNPDWVTSMDQIINRVMARDKGKDFVFKKSDFLPEGSSTGIIAGVPEGKQGFFLDVEKIPGLRFLKQGDRFDLIASFPKASQGSTTEYGLLMGGIKVRGNKPIPMDGIRLLVKGGTMVALTTDRSMTTQGGLELSNATGSGRVSAGRRDERVAIAIDPAEAIPLTQALGDELKIHMVAQSGQATEAEVKVAEINLDDLISFPANSVEIKAFTKIKASDLAEPLSNELRRYYFKPGLADDNWIPNANDLIGKTVSHDIEPGYIFSSADFLPDGSLVEQVAAFQTITSDMFVGKDSKYINAVAARDFEAGHPLVENDVLAAGSLVQDVTPFQAITISDLVASKNSLWVGRYAAKELEKGHLIQEEDLLPANSALKAITPFQQLKIADLVDGSQSPWIGRVASCEIEPGQVIDETLLCKKGSRPSVSAGIPAGMMAVSINSDSIKGLNDLVMGDRVDLIESSIVDLRSSLAGIEVSDALLASGNRQAYNQVVANNALVVRKQDGQFVLAVRVDEVTNLSRSLVLEAELVAIARPDQLNFQEESGNRSDGASKLKSDIYPLSKIVVTELIVGGQKTAKAFRRVDDE